MLKDTKYKNISIDNSTAEAMDKVRKELIAEGERRTGVMPKVSLADVVRISFKYYSDRRKLDIVKDR